MTPPFAGVSDPTTMNCGLKDVQGVTTRPPPPPPTTGCPATVNEPVTEMF